MNCKNVRLAQALTGLFFISLGVLWHQGSQLTLSSGSHTAVKPSENRPCPDTTHSVKTVEKIYQNHHGASTATYQHPRLFLSSLPNDWRNVENVRDRKRLFIQMILPLILVNNAEVLTDRARLLHIAYRQEKGLPITQADTLFLKKMSQMYRVRNASVQKLLTHVDIVPPSLALAQTILETGHGTSQAASRKNSLFGHMATLTQVERFQNLRESVRSYILNLNRHRAYATFQKMRSQLRQRNAPLSSVHLATGLTRYSERGMAYVRDLQSLIRLYNLEQYDHATLTP